MLKRIALALLGLAALIILLVYGAGRGWFFAHEGPGELTEQPIPAELVASRGEARREAARALGVRATSRFSSATSTCTPPSPWTPSS
jgi:hypothetical protein